MRPLQAGQTTLMVQAATTGASTLAGVQACTVGLACTRMAIAMKRSGSMCASASFPKTMPSGGKFACTDVVALRYCCCAASKSKSSFVLDGSRMASDLYRGLDSEYDE